MHCAWTSRHIFGRILFLRTKTAILSVCSSIHTFVTWVDQSKMVQARITKSSPSATWKTLVSGTVKLFQFHKFERGSP